MHRLIKPIFWTILFLAMLLVIDQFLVLVPPVHPAHEAVSKFYTDFRGRLIDLTFGEKKSAPKSVEAIIEKQQAAEEKVTTKAPGTTDKKPTKPAKSAPPQQAQRYIYSDGKGELHFADSLEEVPDEYRGQAQPMAK